MIFANENGNDVANHIVIMPLLIFTNGNDSAPIV
jgi:hypothetical protein